MVRGSWFVKKETAACATVSLGVLNFQFVVNRKSTSQTAFGGQLPYQGSRGDVPATGDLRPATCDLRPATCGTPFGRPLLH